MNFKNIILSFYILLLYNCASVNITKLEAFPKMYDEQPLSILVLPPLNSSTAVAAKEYYLTTVAEPLALSGYYVMPIEIISQIMKDEGIDDSSEFLSLDPSIFREYFDSDAILFTEIIKWDTSYRVVSGSVTVQIKFLLKSLFGDPTWFFVVNPNLDPTLGVATGVKGVYRSM